MLRMPVSALAMTDAASRNSLVAAATGTGAAAGAPPGAAGWIGAAGAVVERAAGWADVPAGSTLSVSRRMSLTFATKVSQNLFAETELIVESELFEPPPPPPEPPEA